MRLVAQSQTVAVAESVTCGWLQTRLGSISGASRFFQGGITAYQWLGEVRLLDVDPMHARKVDCVSALVAEQMAQTVARHFAADWGLATTGYAEPDAAKEIDDPFAYVAIWRRHGDLRQRQVKSHRTGAVIGNERGNAMASQGQVVWLDRISVAGSREEVQREIAARLLAEFAGRLAADERR
ncbi:MAG: CinA family protein [Planctomycetales bacterium]|nr:CinA family protein [Planctomycetales bacterium]